MKEFPKQFSKNNFVKLVSNKDTRSIIQEFPELVYGDGDSKYELSIFVSKMSDDNFNFSIAYQGIKVNKIDTMFYHGPSTNLAEVVCETQKSLEDVDY